MENKIIEILSKFVTEERLDTFKHVIENRTRYLTVVIEDVFQSHNASAVLRSCDCFGIQDVNIIENENKYIVNPDVALGSSKWVSLNRFNKANTNNIKIAINTLRNEGYRIVATTPHANDTNLEDFNIEKGKFALLFGTELNGLTDFALKNSDEYLKIPMYGFTESFNISVSAAIIFHHLTLKLRNSSIDWKLSDKEKDIVLTDWLKKTVKKSDLIIDKFFKKQT